MLEVIDDVSHFVSAHWLNTSFEAGIENDLHRSLRPVSRETRMDHRSHQWQTGHRDIR